MIHSNEVAHTACQYKAVEDFVGTEIFMEPVKHREFAGVNYTADGVNDAAGQEPEKSISVEQGNDVAKGEDAQPAHGDV